MIITKEFVLENFSRLLKYNLENPKDKLFIPMEELSKLDSDTSDMAKKCRQVLLENKNVFNFVDKTLNNFKDDTEDNFLATYSLEEGLSWVKSGKKLFKFAEDKIQSNTKYINDLQNVDLIDAANNFLANNDESVLSDFNKDYYYIVGYEGDNAYANTIYYKDKWIRLGADVKISRDCKPRNIEQKILMNELLKDEKTIIRILSSFGTGKTFISSHYALSKVKDGKKIVLIPNNSTVEFARETGFLKGDLLDKELSYLGGFVDIEGIDAICEKVANEEIEIVSLSQIRGRSFSNCIVLVTEAQNLTKKHIKLLVSRIGEGSKIIFDGDIKQTDKNVFREDNGLLALEKIKDSEYKQLYSDCQLVKTERSRTACVADFL